MLGDETDAEARAMKLRRAVNMWVARILDNGTLNAIRLCDGRRINIKSRHRHRNFLRFHRDGSVNLTTSSKRSRRETSRSRKRKRRGQISRVTDGMQSTQKHHHPIKARSEGKLFASRKQKITQKLHKTHKIYFFSFRGWHVQRTKDKSNYTETN